MNFGKSEQCGRNINDCIGSEEKVAEKKTQPGKLYRQMHVAEGGLSTDCEETTLYDSLNI